MLIIRKSAFDIDDAGLRLGTVRLAKARHGVLQPYPAAFSRLPDAAQGTVAKAIAAWNRNERASALIYLLHLGQPELAPNKGWLRHRELVRMAKAGFDPSQPRDADGMWTSEGGVAGDSGQESVGDASGDARYQSVGYMPVQELFLPGTSSEEVPEGFPGERFSPLGTPDEVPNVVKPPLEQYPTDPTKPPSPDYEWQGRPGSIPGKDPGNYWNPKLEHSLSPDYDHPAPIKPHWDFKPRFPSPEYPDPKGYRWYPDGTMEPKKGIVLFDEEA